MNALDAVTGGETTIKNFNNQAREACASPNAEQPFMCLDLSFISILLEYGFGLKPYTELQVIIKSLCVSHICFISFFINEQFQLYKKINGHETSWALGCAWSILTRRRSSFSLKD